MLSLHLWATVVAIRYANTFTANLLCHTRYCHHLYVHIPETSSHTNAAAGGEGDTFRSSKDVLWTEESTVYE